MELFYGPLILIVLVGIELFITQFWYKKQIPWDEISMNLNSGQVLLWVFRGLEIVGYYHLEKLIGMGLFEGLPTWTVWLVAFLLWDHQFYWLHRLHHKIPILWYVHEVHHQGEHFNLSLGIRNSWFSSLTSLPFFIPLALIGIPADIFLLVSSFHYFVQFYNHNDIIQKSPILDILFVTPDLHKVHHATNDVYKNKNCGGTLNIWDRIYGTFQKQIAGVDMTLGLSKPYQSGNPFWMNIIPFSKRHKRPLKSVSRDTFLHVSTFLLYFELLTYIYLEERVELIVKILYFLLIFLGTISSGGMHENKTWGIIGWTLITLLLPLLILGVSDLQIPLLMGLSAINFVYTIILLIRKYSLKSISHE